MASLLSAKQVSGLLKLKRKQFVESVVGLGSQIVVPAGAPAGSVGVPTPRTPIVLVFAVKSLPARAALQARNAFRDVAQMQLKKMPNGVVKAAARGTPFELMMVRNPPRTAAAASPSSRSAQSERLAHMQWRLFALYLDAG
jgi:hypothetical protein